MEPPPPPTTQQQQQQLITYPRPRRAEDNQIQDVNSNINHNKLILQSVASTSDTRFDHYIIYMYVLYCILLFVNKQ